MAGSISELLNEYNKIASVMATCLHSLQDIKGYENLVTLYKERLKDSSNVEEKEENIAAELAELESSDNLGIGILLNLLKKNHSAFNELQAILIEMSEDEETNKNWIEYRRPIAYDSIGIKKLIEENEKMFIFANTSLKDVYRNLGLTFNSLAELIVNEHNFIKACHELDVPGLQTAIVKYLNTCQKSTPSQVKNYTRDFAVLTEFKTIKNHLDFDLKKLINFSSDTSVFAVEIFDIVSRKEFSDFHKIKLGELCQAYSNIVKYLENLSTDLLEGRYVPENPKEAILLRSYMDVISQPFQRTMRYRMTYEVAANAFLKLIENNFNFSVKSIEGSFQGKRIPIPFKDVIILTLSAFKRRTDFVNKIVDELNIGQKVKRVINFLGIKQENKLNSYVNLLNQVAALKDKNAFEKLKWVERKILIGDWKIAGFGGVTVVHKQFNTTHVVSNHMAEILKCLCPDGENAQNLNREQADELLGKVVAIAQRGKDYKPSRLNFFYQRDPKVQQLLELICQLDPALAVKKDKMVEDDIEMKQNPLVSTST